MYVPETMTARVASRTANSTERTHASNIKKHEARARRNPGQHSQHIIRKSNLRILTNSVSQTLTLSLYRLWVWYKHPLRKIPGPLSASFSNALYSWNFMRGRQPYRQLELHEKYGSIVRVAPNEVSFSSARSWLEIYGPRKGIGTFIKSEFYDGGNFAAEALSIVSERDPKKHAEMRKYLASAFSDRSLKAQEPLIAHSVDLFVEKLGEAGQGNRGTNMVMWYNLMTFDIIGSLAFGQDFGGVESGTEHFWVAIVSKSLRLGALADFFRRFPMLSTIVQTVFSSFIDKLMVENRKHQQYTMDLVQRYARGRKGEKGGDGHCNFQLIQ